MKAAHDRQKKMVSAVNDKELVEKFLTAVQSFEGSRMGDWVPGPEVTVIHGLWDQDIDKDMPKARVIEGIRRDIVRKTDAITKIQNTHAQYRCASPFGSLAPPFLLRFTLLCTRLHPPPSIHPTQVSTLKTRC